MSKKINVNPDHYKVAGRERQGEEVVNREHKQKFGNLQSDLASRAEQRGESLEAMRKRQEQAAREAAPARATPSPAKKKAVKRRPKEALPGKPGKSVPAGPAASKKKAAKKKAAPARKK